MKPVSNNRNPQKSCLKKHQNSLKSCGDRIKLNSALRFKGKAGKVLRKKTYFSLKGGVYHG